ncbi:MAG TPA: S8 family serine peptidase [Pyrinomonadaceae bacterium]|jgi:subtilisin family serine protease
MTKRQFFFLLLAVVVFVNGFVQAQNPKRVVINAADLPRFSYDVPEKLTDLITDDAAYKTFAVKVRADLEGVLRDYDIQDKATLKSIEETLMSLDFQQGKLDSALSRMARIRQLEEKPEAKLYNREAFVVEAIIKARQKSGVTEGAAFQTALREALTSILNRLPDTFSAKLVGEKAAFEFLSDDFFFDVVKSQIAPMAKQSNNTLPGEIAYDLINLRMLHRFIVPVRNDVIEALSAYIAVHKPVNVNIWTARTVTLKNEQKLTPVVVGIWDTGVDVKVFPSQLFINRAEKPNGKDNDGNGFAADVNGIGFDFEEKNTPALLYPLKSEDLKQYPEYIKDWRAASDLRAGIDNEATRALKQKIQMEKSEDAAKEIRLDRVMSSYLHGTHVSGIAVEGNPAARILVVRVTWRDDTGERIPPTEEIVRRTAANWKTEIAYFKAHGVRVVNMSWQTNPQDIESDLEKRKIGKDAAERKRLAKERFTILRNALYEALKNAPEILFVTGAANYNGNSDFTEVIPASFDLPNVLTVGGVDAGGAAANFTNFGKTVTLYANGVDVESFVPGGERMKLSGTSMAAPQVTNLAAKLFALQPKLKVGQAIQLIRDGVDLSGSDNRLKLINPKRTVELLQASKK